jgi:hypothetical protein
MLECEHGTIRFGLINRAWKWHLGFDTDWIFTTGLVGNDCTFEQDLAMGLYKK